MRHKLVISVTALGISLLLFNALSYTSFGNVNGVASQFCQNLYPGLLNATRFCQPTPIQAASIPEVVNPTNRNPYLDYTNFNCDPYLEPGYVKLDPNSSWPDGLLSNTWIPYDHECQSPVPRLLQEVIDRKPLSWLHNKTYLFLGDSIDRNALDQFCGFAGSSTIDSEPTFQIEEDGQIVKTDIPFLKTCTIEHYDLMLVELHFYVQMEEDPIWPWTMNGRYRRPRKLEQRLPWVKQIMDQLGRKPDIIVTGGGLWELQSWARQDAAEGRPFQRSTPVDRLDTWLRRARQYVDLLEATFPDTFHMVRLLHRVRADLGTFFLPVEALELGVDRTERYQFSEERVAELNVLYRQLMKERPEIYAFRWGELLSASMDGFLDHIHPGINAGVLWSDMILYYLYRLKGHGHV